MSTAWFFSATAREDPLKLRFIIGAEIRRHPHSSNDDARLRILRFRLGDDRLQICFENSCRQSAQTVIGTKRDNQHVHFLLQYPIGSAQPIRARVAAHSRIDHIIRKISLANFLRDQRRVSAIFSNS